MATIATQYLPANGKQLKLNFVACNVNGDEFLNTGNELVYFKAATGWTNEVAQIEAVPSADSGRNVSETMTPTAIGDIIMAGPLKRRNWSNTATVKISYPSGITGLLIAVARPSDVG